MGYDSLARRAMFLLAIGALVFPIVITVLTAVAGLLGHLGDAGGSHVIGRVALVCGILWTIDLICLSLIHSLSSLNGPPPGDE